MTRRAREYRDKPLAAWGDGDKGAGLALMMKQWSLDVVLVARGVTGELEKRLSDQNIKVKPAPIAALEGENDVLCDIHFADDTHLDRSALFFSTGCHQRSDLWQSLGCERDEKGGIITAALTEETTVPGVYVAGDVSRDVLLIAVAVAEGAKAAVAINRAILREEGLLL